MIKLYFCSGTLYGATLYGGVDEDEEEPVSAGEETGTIRSINEDE